MTTSTPLLAVLLLSGHVACFRQDAPSGWRHEPLHGEGWLPLSSPGALTRALAELDGRLNHSDQLAGFALQLVYAHTDHDMLADLPQALAAVQCTRWQVLQWEPLRNRAVQLAGREPAEAPPDWPWLQHSLLPVLEASYGYRNDALVNERAMAEQAHADMLESLRADRLRLQAEIATQREQLAALQRPAMDDVLAYLPAIYRNVFGSLAPHDLALLVGRLEVPPVPSPWPEPAPDTLHALQSRLRKLPEARARQLREFCRQLPHPLELRPEMRAWLGAD